MPQVKKYERFNVYNANLAKNPTPTTDYPRMLTSPEDRHTTIVQDAEEHKKLVGAKHFEHEPFWGPSAEGDLGVSAKADPAPAETTPVAGQPNDVKIPETARVRRGLRAQSLDGQAKTSAELVPSQTVFDNALPDPTAKVKTNLLQPKQQQ